MPKEGLYKPLKYLRFSDLAQHMLYRWYNRAEKPGEFDQGDTTMLLPDQVDRLRKQAKGQRRRKRRAEKLGAKLQVAYDGILQDTKGEVHDICGLTRESRANGGTEAPCTWIDPKFWKARKPGFEKADKAEPRLETVVELPDKTLVVKKLTAKQINIQYRFVYTLPSPNGAEGGIIQVYAKRG